MSCKISTPSSRKKNKFEITNFTASALHSHVVGEKHRWVGHYVQNTDMQISPLGQMDDFSQQSWQNQSWQVSREWGVSEVESILIEIFVLAQPNQSWQVWVRWKIYWSRSSTAATLSTFLLETRVSESTPRFRHIEQQAHKLNSTLQEAPKLIIVGAGWCDRNG